MGIWSHCFETEDKAKRTIALLEKTHISFFKDREELYLLIGCDDFIDIISKKTEENLRELCLLKIQEWANNLKIFRKHDPKSVDLLNNYLKLEKNKKNLFKNI